MIPQSLVNIIGSSNRTTKRCVQIINWTINWWLIVTVSIDYRTTQQEWNGYIYDFRLIENNNLHFHHLFTTMEGQNAHVSLSPFIIVIVIISSALPIIWTANIEQLQIALKRSSIIGLKRVCMQMIWWSRKCIQRWHYPKFVLTEVHV